MPKIADFFAELKVKDGLSMTLKTAWQAMADLRLSTIGEIISLGVLGDMLKNAGKEAITMSEGYTTLNKELGINTDMLQRWQNVARSKTTVAPEAVADSFSHLTQVMAGWSHGKMDPGFMQGAAFLGMKINRGMTPDQILEILRSKVPESISKYGASTTFDSLKMMGMEKMMQIFMLNKGQFSSGQFSSPIYGKMEMGEWTKLGENISVINKNLTMLLDEALKPMIPTMIELTQWLLLLEHIGMNTVGKIPAAYFGVKGALQNVDKFQDSINRAIISRLLVPNPKNQATHITNNVKTDVHAHGPDAHSIMPQIKRAFKEGIKEAMTTAAQSQNAQVAY